jgi:hypothetical protein
MAPGPTTREATTPEPAPAEPDWFERLPQAEQQRLIRRWEAREHHQGEDPARTRAMRTESIRNGAITLAIAIGATSFWTSSLGATSWRIVLAAILGAAVGAVMHGTNVGRFGSAALGAAGWAVTLAWTHGFAAGGVIQLVLLFCGLMLAIYLFAALGVAKEFRGSV